MIGVRQNPQQAHTIGRCKMTFTDERLIIINEIRKLEFELWVAEQELRLAKSDMQRQSLELKIQMIKAQLALKGVLYEIS